MADKDVVDNAQIAEAHNEQIRQRRHKLTQLRASQQAYVNTFKRDHLAKALHDQYGEWSHEQLDQETVTVQVAGRMMLRRVMGKASFATVQDMSGRIQLYVARDDLPEGLYADFKHWDFFFAIFWKNCVSGAGTRGKLIFDRFKKLISEV